MTIYIQAMEIEIAYILAEELESRKYTCQCFQSFSTLFAALENSKHIPDLIAADFTAFNHDYFNANKNLLEKNIFTPVIFYNDPCFTRSTRAKHWESFIEERIESLPKDSQARFFYETRYEEFKKVFLQIETLVTSDLLRPYIPLMTPALPLPEEVTRSYSQRLKDNSKGNLILDFKNRVLLPNNLYNLLIILYENRGRIISAKELSEIYTKYHKEISENSIKILISQLRKYIKEEADCSFIVADRSSGYIFI